MKTARKPGRNQADMAGMMSKLLRQQAAPNVDIDIFSGDTVDYHYFIAVFEEVVEKKNDDPRGRLIRLIKSTDCEPKEMIKHFIQQSVSVGHKNAGRKLCESTLYSSSLLKENLFLITTQTSRWNSIQEIF